MDITAKWQNILQDAQNFAENDLGFSIAIPIKINGRIKALGNFTSRYSYFMRQAIAINISKNHLIYDDYNMVLDTLKHELCHYYLFINGSTGWKDGQKEFENLLKKHGIASSGTSKNTFGNEKTGESKKPMIYYMDKMGDTIKRNRRLNRGRYFTGENGRYYEVGKYTPQVFEEIKSQLLKKIHEVENAN